MQQTTDNGDYRINGDNMTVSQLIEWLKKCDPDLEIRSEFGSIGEPSEEIDQDEKRFILII